MAVGYGGPVRETNMAVGYGGLVRETNMAVVSVRIEDDVLAVLKAHQVNVSEVAREALGDRARRLRALDGLKRLRQWSAPAGDEPVVDIIRKRRDER